MDATGRLTYRLLNTDTRTKVRHGGLFHPDQLAGLLLKQIQICNSDVSLYLLFSDHFLKKWLFSVERKKKKNANGVEEKAKSRPVATDRRACWPTQVARIWIRSAVHLDKLAS